MPTGRWYCGKLDESYWLATLATGLGLADLPISLMSVMSVDRNIADRLGPKHPWGST